MEAKIKDKEKSVAGDRGGCQFAPLFLDSTFLTIQKNMMAEKNTNQNETTWFFDEAELERIYNRGAIRQMFSEHEPKADLGWSVMPFDPMKLLEAFPRLSMRQGFVLRGYRHVEEKGARGIVWAVPAGANPQAPGECTFVSLRGREVPRPDGAREDFMEALEGDGSPESIISAGFFAREARELGAFRYGASWAFEEILFKDPTRAARGQVESWDFEMKRPRSWKPRLAIGPDGATVVFHTHRRLDREAVLRTVDRFPQKESLMFETDWVELAYGKTSYYP